MTTSDVADGLARGADLMRRLTNHALEYERTTLAPAVFPMSAEEGLWFIEALSRAVMLLEKEERDGLPSIARGP